MMLLMIRSPFLRLQTVNRCQTSDFQRITETQKAWIYRLKKTQRVPWRSIGHGMVKHFQTRTHLPKIVAPNSAFIIDNVTDPGAGLKSKRSHLCTILWPARRERRTTDLAPPKPIGVSHNIYRRQPVVLYRTFGADDGIRRLEQSLTAVLSADRKHLELLANWGVTDTAETFRSA